MSRMEGKMKHIKRYHLGYQSMSVGDELVACMDEHVKGEWVKWDDVKSRADAHLVEGSYKETRSCAPSLSGMSPEDAVSTIRGTQGGARIAEYQDLCAQVYQVVGALADDEDVFGAVETQSVLDNLGAGISNEPFPHKDLLPYQLGLIRKAIPAPTAPLEEAVVDEVTFLDGASADGAAFLPDDIQVHGGKRGDRVPG